MLVVISQVVKITFVSPLWKGLLFGMISRLVEQQSFQVTIYWLIDYPG